MSIGINLDRIKQREDTAESTKGTCHNVRTSRLSVLSGLSEKKKRQLQSHVVSI